ncbi:hypothetical protein [Zavarzinia sp. CC-PAN008]|uniref:hypothetical protein n=1 Tax=Zavarzinia sp. CC-PAN008 TaxID=3243332 RepID=UPI003F7482C2
MALADIERTTPEEDAAITAAAMSDHDNPPLSAERLSGFRRLADDPAMLARLQASAAGPFSAEAKSLPGADAAGKGALFEIYQDRAGAFRVRFKVDAETKFSGGPYRSREEARGAIDLLRQAGSVARIVDAAA